MWTRSKGKQHADDTAGPSRQRSPSTLYNTQPEPRNSPPQQPQLDSARIEEIPEEEEQAPNNEESSESQEFEDAQEQHPQQPQRPAEVPGATVAANLLTALADSLQAFNYNREPPRAKL
jgi:cell envelope opacity-associated protein A